MRKERAINCSWIVLIVSLVATYFVGPSARITHAAHEDTAKARKIVAKVNGKPIYEDQLTSQVESRVRKFEKYGMRQRSRDLVKRLQRRALDRIIGEQLIYQESRKLTIEDIDEQVRQKLKSLQSKYGAGERFEKFLKIRRLSMEGLRKSLRTRVYVDEYLRRQGISEPEIAEERIREMYEHDLDGYSREETVRVSHILIGVDADAGGEEKEQARQEAVNVHRAINEGKDFAEMAREHSDCNSASGGGSLGYIKKGYMPERFERVAFALEENAVSDVVQTKFGYHIMKIFDKRPAGTTPYEEARDFIRKYLQEQESKKRLAEHIAELKRTAKIEILLD